MLQKTTLLFVIIINSLMCMAQYEANWESLDSREIPEWFQNAKFGIFIHWGVYSVPAYRPVSEKRYASYAEWYYATVYQDSVLRENFHNKNYGEGFDYHDFAPLFMAEFFDPEYWAELFKKAGAKYVVLTSKHHDGFCLWPTKIKGYENWNAGDTGPRQDLLGNLAAAVREEGLKFGLYYSLMEWETHTCSGEKDYLDEATKEKYGHNPDTYVDKQMIPQLKELVTRYRPALIFSDGEWDYSADYWKSTEFLKWLYNNAPNKESVVVNDRWGKGVRGKHGGYYTSEYASEKEKLGSSHYWEESRGIGGSYGFNRAENIDDYRTSDELIMELIEIVSNGGNLLLNVGPTADGRIPVIMQQRLSDIGKWLQVYGEAIYSTRPWRQAEKHQELNPETYYTKKDKDLYILMKDYPKKKIQLKTNGIPIENITLLGFNVSLTFSETNDNTIEIEPPVVRVSEVYCNTPYVIKVTGFFE